jgi:hypothetical protein
VKLATQDLKSNGQLASVSPQNHRKR